MSFVVALSNLTQVPPHSLRSATISRDSRCQPTRKNKKPNVMERSKLKQADCVSVTMPLGSASLPNFLTAMMHVDTWLTTQRRTANKHRSTQIFVF